MPTLTPPALPADRALNVISRGILGLIVETIDRTRLKTKVKEVRSLYQITNAPSDWGRAFRVKKVAGKDRVGNVYYTVVGRAGCEEGENFCDCTDGLARGNCRHVAMAQACMAKGIIQ